MAPSPRSPTDARDALSPRRHPHHPARFPSLTEFPDSPSVYSHAYHSPNADMHSATEFDDETASTIRSLSPEDFQDDSDMDDCADDASHCISLGGPKIRFHSRAPWETDDDSSHVNEPDNNPRSSTAGNKPKGKPSRADSLIRTLTRGSHIASRPSVDSARSQASSFEVTAGNYSGSRGALYDLARQMSNSSLTSSSASVRSQNFARTTNHPKSSYYHIHDSLARAVSLDGMVPRAMIPESVPIRPSSSHVGHERRVKPSLVSLSRDQFVHPYANPDLVVAYTPSPETIPSHQPISGGMAGSDSNSTITDSTSTRSTALSVVSTETSTSSTSRDILHGTLRINGKEISSPISVVHPNDAGYADRSNRFLSLHPPPVGFEGPHPNNPRSPTVALISLQEAQARERFRSNTVHTTAARSKPPFPGSDDILEVTEDETVEVDTSGKTAHTRVRSTSAGAGRKAAPLPSARPHIPEMKDESPAAAPASAVPGRTLKHKKSGFMRLFGGRNSEGEKEKSPPPPIPPLGDVHVEESLQIHGTGKTSKITLPSVPKPSFSPTLPRTRASSATLASTHSASSGGDGPHGKGHSSRRKQPPPLTIVTKTSDHNLATLVSGKSSPMGLNFTPPPPLSLTVPQSAPPGSSDFPGLQLRPVSVSFSSHFADMVGAKEELYRGVHSPSSAASSNTALSPFTPVSTRRSDDASATAIETPGEEYLTIKGLQDQLVSAKKAWQQQVWELRGQIRDLTSELEDLRVADYQEYCEVCGRGERKCHASDEQQGKKVGIVNRPRVRTGDAARFASGN